MPYPPFGPAVSQWPRKPLGVIEHEYQRELAGAMLPGSWRGSRERVLSISDTAKYIAQRSFSDYMAQYGGDHARDDDGSLTEMMTENDSTKSPRPDKAA